MYAFIFKILNVKISMAVWQICLIFLFISGVFLSMQISKSKDMRNRHKEIVKYEEVIIEREKYITNISFKFIRQELENFYDHKIPESDLTKLNSLISNIINN